MKVAVIGGGWAGMAAAVAHTQRGHHVTVFEATHTLGGRARALEVTPHLATGSPHTGLESAQPKAAPLTLDNGQHILIGAYSACLQLMHMVGVDATQHTLRLPLQMLFPDGTGLGLPDLPPPWDALVGIARAKGWGWRDKLALLQRTTGWQLRGFTCAPHTTVAQLCAGLPRRLIDDLIDPLCISALNTPTEQASAQVFLRMLQDSLFSGRGGSNLLLPRTDLSQLMPKAAAQWLATRKGHVRTGQRVAALTPLPTGRWQIQCAQAQTDADHIFDHVTLACPAWEAARLVGAIGRSPQNLAETTSNPLASQDFAALGSWADMAAALQYTAITTVYAYAPQARLPLPMMALRSNTNFGSNTDQPAQFAFDKGALNAEHSGVIALVISASNGSRNQLQVQALAQAQQQLALPPLQALQTVVEKRATFACTPGLQRPPMYIAPGLNACGDYLAGPYPATLEGAVRSGLTAGGSMDVAYQQSYPA